MRLPRTTTRRLMIATALVAIVIVACPDRSGREFDTLCLPFQIEGEVASVDGAGDRVELAIGSDDGVKSGLEMNVYRAEAPSSWVGKLRILSLDPDHSVGQVVARSGPRAVIRKGDKVSLYPRSPVPFAGTPGL